MGAWPRPGPGLAQAWPGPDPKLPVRQVNLDGTLFAVAERDGRRPVAEPLEQLTILLLAVFEIVERRHQIAFARRQATDEEAAIGVRAGRADESRRSSPLRRVLWKDQDVVIAVVSVRLDRPAQRGQPIGHDHAKR